jgi:hypothetical protein
MAGSNKRRSWQIRVDNKLRELEDHPDFVEDMTLLMKLRTSEPHLHQAAKQLCYKYGAPKSFIGVLKGIATTGKLHLDEATPPIMLVSEVDEEMIPGDGPRNGYRAYQEYQSVTQSPRVYLELTGDTQRADIDEFLDEYYKGAIEPKLEKLEPRRIGAFKSKQLLKRDYRIMSLYKGKVADTTRRHSIYKEIAEETGVSDDIIRKVIKRYRAQKKWDITTG